MGTLELLRLCTAVICTFGSNRTLREFELLAYEQACRTLETVLRDHRKIWENETDEFESYQR